MLILEDDLKFCPHFGPRVTKMVANIERLTRRYVFSLYLPYSGAEFWPSICKGVALYPVDHFYAMQAMYYAPWSKRAFATFLFDEVCEGALCLALRLGW